MYDYTTKKIAEFDFADKNNEDHKHLLSLNFAVYAMTDPLKAARWIGYALRMAEDLGFWDNTVSRYYIRQDVNSGKDRC